MQNKRSVGSTYEEMAVRYLKMNGYKIVEQNFRCRQGEIDIIAKKDGYLVFVEVKYRSNEKKGSPAEAVNYYKQQKIIQAARYYMMKHHYSDDVPCRFDVIGILGEKVKLYENAFMY